MASHLNDDDSILFSFDQATDVVKFNDCNVDNYSDGSLSRNEFEERFVDSIPDIVFVRS